MALQYAFLSEVFPNFGEQSTQQTTVTDSVEENPPTYTKNNEDLILKPFEKLRIIDGKLAVDRRYFKCIFRKFSGDDRYSILELVRDLKNKSSVIKELSNSTYCNDKAWIQKALLYDWNN